MVNFCLLIITRQNQKILVLVTSLGKQPKFRNATTLTRPLLLTLHGKFKGMQFDFSTVPNDDFLTRKTSPRNELLVGSTISVALSRLPREESEGGGREERGLISLSAADNQA